MPTTDSVQSNLDVHECDDYITNTTNNVHTLTFRGDFDVYIYGKVTAGTATVELTNNAVGALAIGAMSLDSTGTAQDIKGRFPVKDGDTAALSLASGATGFLCVRVVSPRRGS